jgi:hypothetical protein
MKGKFIFYKLFLPLILIGIIFCNENLLSEEETIQLFNVVQELEYKDSLNLQIINNLELQLQDYSKLYDNSLLQIEDYKTQVKLHKDMIDLVKPKWYENKYLWFFGGVIITSGAVYLAGQID